MCRDETTIAWAAGFIDGEGCLWTGKSTVPRLRISIEVGQVDQRPLEKLQTMFGGVIKEDGKPKRPTHRMKYKWCLYSQADIKSCLSLIRPYLIVKGEAADRLLVLIAEWEMREDRRGLHQSRKSHCPSGHPYTEENTYRTANGARMCKKCRQIHHQKHDLKKRGPLPIT